MDYLWDAVDSFRRAIYLTHEQDLETEAKAYTYLGKIYDVFLHNSARAKECCKQALSLVKSHQDGKFGKLSSEGWFKDCLTRLEGTKVVHLFSFLLVIWGL